VYSNFLAHNLQQNVSPSTWPKLSQYEYDYSYHVHYDYDYDCWLWL